MASEAQGIALILMGVSGAGKSTIGEMLGKSMGCTFLDADDFHPESNKEKMKKGIPLSEEDRIPWLEMLRDTLKEKLIMTGEKVIILGCSALQKHYRDILRSADPNYKAGIYERCMVRFVLLEVGEEVLISRLERRAGEGKHFMPAALLNSQLALLEIDDDEGILKIDATLNPLVIVETIMTKHNQM
ncbi:gluconokinase isoform X2 [Impatiens glandulifera]|uniref:gluconokinase isoform X2 n=1 Tax=Impatiens glandulifera TaxID=253017 RepID=UPI001FB05CD6|nr:gluconokinase isoform X2 [Impatiens glandulifera]